MEPTRLQYYEEYVTRCWEARQYYKDETNKLLYWIGTVFITIVGATGIFGANQGQRFNFTLIHILLFHVMFAVVWCYYLYKQLNVDLFQALGEKMEHYLRSFYKMDELREFRCFFGVKSYYLGNHAGHGRSLTKFANGGLILLYLIVTSVPIFKGRIFVDKISINWDFLVSSSVFGILVFGVFLLYSSKRKRVIESVNVDWLTFIERFPPAQWKRLSSKI